MLNIKHNYDIPLTLMNQFGPYPQGSIFIFQVPCQHEQCNHSQLKTEPQTQCNIQQPKVEQQPKTEQQPKIDQHYDNIQPIDQRHDNIQPIDQSQQNKESALKSLPLKLIAVNGDQYVTSYTGNLYPLRNNNANIEQTINYAYPNDDDVTRELMQMMIDEKNGHDVVA